MAGRRKIHPAWSVLVVAFIALLASAAFRSAPGVLMVPLQQEFGWSRTEISSSVTVNLMFFGATAPFAAALIARFGIRNVTVSALCLIAAGAASSLLASSPWLLMLSWGLLIGVGSGSIALVFASSIAETWFVRSRGLALGVLSAATATGQLVFLPLLSSLSASVGWRGATLVVAAAALGVVPLVWVALRATPAERQIAPYGAEPGWAPALNPAGNPARRAIDVLLRVRHRRTFWALAAGFAICGATTNGLVGAHFIPSAHDHGLAENVAAGLLALVGAFDIVGTVASGWLTDRYNPRLLLPVYYGCRGLGLLMLPVLLTSTVQPPMIVFIVIYGLDWVATVPPTVALCRELFGQDGGIVFGWVFAAHQMGAAAAALGAGIVRDAWGSYSPAWLGAAGLCALAAVMSALIQKGAPHGRRLLVSKAG